LAGWWMLRMLGEKAIDEGRWTWDEGVGFDFGCGYLGEVGCLGGAGIGFGWVWIGYVLLVWGVGLGLIGFVLGLFFWGVRRGESL